IYDDLLNHCLVTYTEKDIFSKVSEEDIIQTFMTKAKRTLR
ncbi:Os07g0199350, partial [Oryza sativa Japonica Group]